MTDAAAAAPDLAELQRNAATSPSSSSAPESIENPALGAIDAELERGEQPAAPMAAPLVVPSLYEKNRAFIALGIVGAREFVSVAGHLTSLRLTLGDAEVAALSEAWAKVAAKHERDLSAIVGDFGEELAAIVVTFGIFRAVKMGLDAEQAAKREAAELAAKPTPDPPPA